MSDSTDAVAPARGVDRFRGKTRMALGEIRGEVLAFACLTPLLLAAVLWNGFPIIFYDTGAYVLEGLGGNFLVERSSVYSLFLRFAGAGASLWFVVLFQAAATAFVMVQCARAIFPRLGLGLFLILAAALIVGSGLPWYVGQIEPDCFTAIAVLTVYLPGFRTGALGRARVGILVALGGLAAAVHPSHLLLAGFLLALLAMMKAALRFAKNRSAYPSPRLAGPALVCFLGLALTIAGNFTFTHQIFVSRAGTSFLFARMLQDGIVMRLLDDTCPKSGYRLCAYRDALPPSADGWLWTPKSPFFKLGHFEGTAAESGRIVRDALLRYPLMQLQLAVRDAATQFLRIRTGDQIEPQEWVLYPVLSHFMPAQMPAYLAARQQRGEMDFRVIGTLHVAVGFFSLAGLFVLLAMAIFARRRAEAAFLAFIAAALIGNAMICGVLSGPHDRYQSRLVWLTPFAILLAGPRVFQWRDR
jgi:hypothetical protein